MRRKKPESLTSLADKLREKTDSAVVSLLGKHGRLSEGQITAYLHIARSTAWKSLGRLRDAGKVRRLRLKQHAEARGPLATFFELGDERPVLEEGTLAEYMHPLYWVAHEWRGTSPVMTGAQTEWQGQVHYMADEEPEEIAA